MLGLAHNNLSYRDGTVEPFFARVSNFQSCPINQQTAGTRDSRNLIFTTIE